MDLPLVELSGIVKSFSGQRALDNVTLRFRRGELHAVVGENGAGKSTLLNVLFGLTQPDEGGIVLSGRQVIHRAPADAIANGIGMVHQHFKLIGSFTVAENLRLAAPRAVRGRLSGSAAVAAIARDHGLPLDPDAPVATLPLALQQRVEILKALVNEAALVLFDEPTTILNPAEVDEFYATCRRIVAGGRAVVVVTHHLEEVLAHADHVSVIRRGRLVRSGPVRDASRDDLVRDIVGRAVDLDTPLRGTARPGAVAVALDAVRVAPTPSSSGLDGASLAVAAGEVLGVAGVEGNGQRELFDLLAGLRAPDGGTLHGPTRDGRIHAGLVPEDRHAEGLVLDLPIALNLVLPRLDAAPFARAGRLDHRAIAAEAERMRAAADIRTASVEATPRTLSGGNQQKIVLARALAEDAPVLVAYQPTRGLDVAASEDVLARLRAAADLGKAVVVISSNLDELVRLCDRIVVLYAGRTVGEVAPDTPREVIGAMMTGARMAEAA